MTPSVASTGTELASAATLSPGTVGAPLTVFLNRRAEAALASAARPLVNHTLFQVDPLKLLPQEHGALGAESVFLPPDRNPADSF